MRLIPPYPIRMKAIRAILVVFVASIFMAPVALPLAAGAATNLAGPQVPTGIPATSITQLSLHPDYIGGPTFQGSIICNDGQVLAFEGIITWGASWQSIGNGSRVFSNEITLVMYDLTSSPQVVKIVTTQQGQTTNTSTTVYPDTPDSTTVSLVSDINWVATKVVIGGIPQYFSVATPISLLPSAFANVGGLDLLVLVVISEAVVAFGGVIAISRWLMQKAIWAPRFSLLIWGHVVLVGIAGAVLLDFQWVDQTFAGWSPLVYVFAVTPMFFAFSLSFFNRAPAAVLIRANAPLAGKMTYNFYPLLTAKDAKGQEVIIDPSWRGFWARVWGHHVVLITAEAQITKSEPFVAAVVHRRIIGKREFLRRVARPSDRKATPLDDFDVVPATVDGRPLRGRSWLPVKLFWTPTGRPVNVDWPRLTIHKTVDVPAEYTESENIPGERRVTKPARTETRLSFPHYTKGSADITLAPIHYRSSQSVVAGWRSAEDLAAVLSDTALDLEALKSSFESEVARKVRERLVARESLMARPINDLDEHEAAQEALRLKDTLSSLDTLLGRGPVMTSLSPEEKIRRAAEKG